MDPRHRSFFNKIQVKILKSKFLVEFRFGEKLRFKPRLLKGKLFCLADEIPKKSFVACRLAW